MVLELLFAEKTVKRHPAFMLAESMLLATVGIWGAAYLFPQSASLVAIVLTTIGLIPLFHQLMDDEEEDEEKKPGTPLTFLGRHGEIIEIFGYFFLGLVIAYSVWFYVLPISAVPDACIGEICFKIPSSDQVFSEQEKSLGVVSAIRGNFALEHEVTRSDCFGVNKNVENCANFIFQNNAGVLAFAILLSILYGVGAILLLGWNASVLGVKIGQWGHEFQNLGQGFFQAVGILGHGIPEFLAYFLGAIAGGIISAAITRGHLHTKMFETIAKDTLILLIMAYALLLVAAFIEAASIVWGV